MARHLIRFVAALSVVGCTALAGCSTGDTQSSSGDSSAGDATLTIYSPQGEGTRADFITDAAQKELGITVKFVSGGGGDLTTRLIQEKSNPQADVVLGLGEAQLNQIDQAGVLQAYSPSWLDKVPESYRGGSQDFTLSTQTPIVMAYNPSTIGSLPVPTSWSDLANPIYRNTFVFPTITSQTGQAAAVGILWQYTDHSTGEVSQEGWDTLTAIMNNSYQVSSGQSFDWSWVTSGQQPIVINWLGGIQTGEKDNNLNLTLVNPASGSPYVQTGVGIVAGSKNADTAKKFLDWFGSADVQTRFVQATNSDTPVNTDAVAALGETASQLSTITKEDIDWSIVSGQLTDWLEKIQLGGSAS